MTVLHSVLPSTMRGKKRETAPTPIRTSDATPYTKIPRNAPDPNIERLSMTRVGQCMILTTCGGEVFLTLSGGFGLFKSWPRIGWE